MDIILAKEMIKETLGYMHEPIPTTLVVIVKLLIMEFHDITFENVAKLWVESHREYCTCLERLEYIKKIAIVKHCLHVLKSDLMCNHVHLVYEYSMINNGVFPTLEELENLEHNHDLLSNDPDMYHGSNKVIVPTRNIENLPILKVETETTCAFCLDILNIGTSAYQVPCCKNIFHAIGSECLGQTIIDWLKISKKCPTCNLEVILE